MSLHSQNYTRSSGFDDQHSQSHGVWVCTQVEWTGLGRGGLVRLYYRSTQIRSFDVTALTTLPQVLWFDDQS